MVGLTSEASASLGYPDNDESSPVEPDENLASGSHIPGDQSFEVQLVHEPPSLEAAQRPRDPAIDALSRKSDMLSMECDELRSVAQAESQRREALERELELEKRHNEQLTASSSVKLLSLEKALTKAQSMWMSLELELAGSQVEVSQLREVLENANASLTDTQNELTAEREERLRLAMLLEAS